MSCGAKFICFARVNPGGTARNGNSDVAGCGHRRERCGGKQVNVSLRGVTITRRGWSRPCGGCHPREIYALGRQRPVPVPSDGETRQEPVGHPFPAHGRLRSRHSTYGGPHPQLSRRGGIDLVHSRRPRGFQVRLGGERQFPPIVYCGFEKVTGDVAGKRNNRALPRKTHHSQWDQPVAVFNGQNKWMHGTGSAMAWVLAFQAAKPEKRLWECHFFQGRASIYSPTVDRATCLYRARAKMKPAGTEIFGWRAAIKG